VAIYRVAKDGREQGFLLSLLDEVERRQQVFTNIFGWSGNVVLTAEAGGQPSTSIANAVTGDYYSSLGVRPLMGRLIEPADEAGNEPRAVNSESTELHSLTMLQPCSQAVDLKVNRHFGEGQGDGDGQRRDRFRSR
jgi:hypothetical protein